MPYGIVKMRVKWHNEGRPSAIFVTRPSPRAVYFYTKWQFFKCIILKDVLTNSSGSYRTVVPFDLSTQSTLKLYNWFLFHEELDVLCYSNLQTYYKQVQVLGLGIYFPTLTWHFYWYWCDLTFEIFLTGGWLPSYNIAASTTAK